MQLVVPTSTSLAPLVLTQPELSHRAHCLPAGPDSAFAAHEYDKGRYQGRGGAQNMQARFNELQMPTSRQQRKQPSTARPNNPLKQRRYTH